VAVFALIGALLGVYTLYAAITGAVLAKSGAWGRRVQRSQTPVYFWTVIAIYAILSVLLMTVF
jgi:hypothetical protein